MLYSCAKLTKIIDDIFLRKQAPTMMETWKLTIPELSGDTPRRAYVYVPDSFGEDETQRYPVLYMFDGHNVFFDEDATYGKSWGMKDYMDFSETQLIIAAVECNHSPDGGRLSEYSPFDFRAKGLGNLKGRGRETMEWMVNEFKPYIDEHYPTLPERETTFIGGSSMGGLMSLYAVMEYNHVFSRAACLSPSIWFSVGKLDQMIRDAELLPDTVVYMDYGSRELGFHPNMKRQFTRVASQLIHKGVYLDCRIVPGGNHNEASWERQVPFFLNTLLYDKE